MTTNAAASRSVELSIGTIRYDDVGAGSPLVFVHGILVSGVLWRSVVPALRSSFRCIVPTLPLGAHTVPMPAGADLSPRGLARAIAEFLEVLDLRDVTLVGNDTGGALCQLVIAHHPERIARLVLTNCDAFEYFPPLVLSPLYGAAHVPGFLWALAQLLRLRPLQRLFFAMVARRKPDPAFLAASFGPFIADARVRGDLRTTMRAVSRRDTLAAAKKFASFGGPVLILWGADDLFFPIGLARRLVHAFPNARLQIVEGSRTFLSEDNPMALVASLEAFVAAPAVA